MSDEPRESDGSIDEPSESDDSIDARWQRSLAAVGGFHSGTGDLSKNHDEEFAAASEE